MTDAWCHGKPCGDRVTFSGTPLNWMRFVSAGSADSTPGQCICPGCFARAQPHATGPHTRIVEEWEHEYGALCRVVVGPWVLRSQLMNVTIDYVTRCAHEAAAVVGAAAYEPREWVQPGRSQERLGDPVASECEAVSLAMLDAERLALEWSPPVDEEAA